MTRTQHTTPAVRRRPWQIVLVGAALTALANVVVLAVATLAGASFVLLDDPAVPHVVDLLDVVVSSAVPLALGTALAALLQLWWQKALLAGQIVGTGLAVLSAGGPLMAVADTATVVALTTMHLLVGVAVYATLARLRTGRIIR